MERRRQQSWLSRHPFLHRMFNAVVVLFLLWGLWNAVLLTLHLL